MRSRRFRIAVDYGYSAASFTLPLVFGPLGVEAIATHAFLVEDSGTPELATADVQRIVTGVGADLGLVFDRAAERLVLVDETGRELARDLALLLVVRLLALAGRAGIVAVPVTATGLVDDLARDSGLTVLRTQHSVSALTHAAAEPSVLFAGAPTGGFVFPDVVPGYDAMSASCKLLELLASSGRALSELVDELPQPVLVRRALPCPWSRKGLVMRVVHERLAERELDLLDGVKAFDERGWVQALLDPHEPIVHVFAEGANAEASELLADELTDAIENAVEGGESGRRITEQASS